MAGMATWEDGPEYAPAQRPDHFTDPAVAPLEPTAPPDQPAAGRPAERPRFDVPAVPVAPLSDLVPPVEDTRDPQQPFDVVSSAATEASSAWSAVHWSGPPGTAPLGPVPAPVPVPLSNGSAWPAPPAAPPGSPAPNGSFPAPDLPFPPASGPPTTAGGYPAPGTTQWFAPPPPVHVPPAPGPVTARQVVQAATPGVLICLLVAGLIYPLTPVAILVGLALTSRVTVARRAVQAVFGLLVAILMLATLVGLGRLLAEDYLASEVWAMIARWGQVCAWPALVAVLVVVRRGFGPAGGARPPGTWG